MATPHISVCICTFRRPSVVQTIESIAHQNIDPDLGIEVIVVDNDVEPSAREDVEAAHLAHSHLDLKYVHAPARNISIARNACLDNANGEWVAFIDDDEIASEDWLRIHHENAVRGHFDIYFGPVVAVYPEDAPSWFRDADMHSIRVDDRRPIVTGHTSNVFFKREHSAIKTVRFSELRGRTGGEDTEFFHECFRGGARIEETESAIVFEPVAPNRLELNWIAKHKFRSGITYGKVIHYRSGFLVNTLKLLTSLSKASLLYFTSLLQFRSKVASRRNYLRAVFHGGVIAAFFAVREAEHYGVVTGPGTEMSETAS